MNQKQEVLLQLALETPEATRERTEDLNVGYQAETNSWEVIVKYHGNLWELEAVGVAFEELIAGYAILNVPENLIDFVSGLEQIEYLEMPKTFYYQMNYPVDDSCIEEVNRRDFGLSGKGVLLAILDSGIDYRRPEFRSNDGRTRIRFLMDQTLGREFDEGDINAALQEDDPGRQYELLPSFDVSGHGTAVAGIAAGSVIKSDTYVGQENEYRGVALLADLLIVKLGQPRVNSFPRTIEIMRGVTWALQKAEELGMPLVINLSFGNSYGAHDGSSLLERFLDNAAEIGRTVICVGSGNEGANGGHLAGKVETRNTTGTSVGVESLGNRDFEYGGTTAELVVAGYERSLSLQLWKEYTDVFRIYLRSPAGEEIALPDTLQRGFVRKYAGNTEILIFYGEPTPYRTRQEIYFEFIVREEVVEDPARATIEERSGTVAGNPAGATSRRSFYIDSGSWQIRLEPVRVVNGEFVMYLPAGSGRNAGTGFTAPSPQMTLTIPSTASKVLTVGAYDSVYDSYADFSGRGYETNFGVINPQTAVQRPVGTVNFDKPDLAAPGVNILAPDIYGGLSAFSGTSFATPIVSGCAALLMEYGIVQGNDPYLYGEKVKAYLRKGALPIRGESRYPNGKVGWGKLCLKASI